VCVLGEIETCKDHWWMIYISRLDDEPGSQHELIYNSTLLIWLPVLSVSIYHLQKK
jgi:hypothetical protein